MVKQKGASFKTDIYGIGLVLYEMLYGESPFYTNNLQELYQSIANSPVPFPNKRVVSSQCKDLLSNLLHKEPKK
jgi:serum/glucocorticoid-regulated kinase 2